MLRVGFVLRSTEIQPVCFRFVSPAWLSLFSRSRCVCGLGSSAAVRCAGLVPPARRLELQIAPRSRRRGRLPRPTGPDSGVATLRWCSIALGWDAPGALGLGQIFGSGLRRRRGRCVWGGPLCAGWAGLEGRRALGWPTLRWCSIALGWDAPGAPGLSRWAESWERCGGPGPAAPLGKASLTGAGAGSAADARTP